MLRRTFWCSGLILVLAATVAQAQDTKKGGGQGQGRGGFGQGPGGFGPGGFGQQGGGAMLLGSPEVQKELAVTDEQKGLIEDMVADLREQGRNLFAGGGNFQEFQNLSQEERQKRFDEMRKKGEEMAKKSEEMVNMILEPKQVERLGQLRLQQENVVAFNRDDIAKKLGLTQEQRDKIKKIQEDGRPQGAGGGFQNFQNMSDEERREFFTKMREQREKVNTDLLAVLTADQKTNWEKMQGKKFEFPQPQFGRPGGGGDGAPTKKKTDR